MVAFVGELPPPSGHRHDWYEIANELKENPGQWAVVNEHRLDVTASSAQQLARTIRDGRNKFMRAGEFEATTRGTSIYARYVGNRD